MEEVIPEGIRLKDGIMTLQGWIKLHRKSLDSTAFKRPIVWKVWCWCLLKATHKREGIPFKGVDMEIKPGEFVTGRDKACLALNLTPQKYRTALEYLKTTNRITIKTNNKFTVISVKNWESYQFEESSNQQTNQPITNQQPTNNQPITTYKKDKKEKNEKTDKKKRTGGFAPPTHGEVAEQIKLKGYQNITPDRFINFYGSKGWMVGRNKMTKWKLALARADNWDTKTTDAGKAKLFPIPGKVCGQRGCGFPAVYKSSGDFSHYYCKTHMPDKVKAEYV